MKTLYIDCGMGAAGDMLTAALYELLEDKEGFLQKMNSLGLPKVRISAEKAAKCGITGTQMRVLIDGEEENGHVHEHEHEHEHHEHEHEHHEHMHGQHHHHSSMEEIREIVGGLPVSENVRRNVLDVYGMIAEAESQAHGVPVTEIHFHEVGTLDAIADVTAVCLLMELLAVDKVLSTPVHVGCGHVHCAHGILPVPSPATAFILRGIPIYGGDIQGELCTPTGAALLKKFVMAFGPMPVMRISKIGYGMGKKDFSRANCVRALLGETEEADEQIVEFKCCLDDMTPEQIGFAKERLFDSGAVEVYTIPIGMKKSRPGTLLCVMCREAERQAMLEQLFRHTSTLGIRENRSDRHVLQRSIESVNTPWGPVRRKISKGYGVCRSKYEYEDLARIARDNNMSIEDILGQIAILNGER
ncbi:MAG: nickel pincer cofactor biosynthesis protein LarC [Victivallales bacterium]|nr:nickel pincer cofactor biosynthesis protein LarC [Victivallales bacterium]